MTVCFRAVVGCRCLGRWVVSSGSLIQTDIFLASRVLSALCVCVRVRFGVIFAHRNAGLQLSLSWNNLPSRGNPWVIFSRQCTRLQLTQPRHLLFFQYLVKALNCLVATFNRKSSNSFESCLACWTALVYFRVYSRACFSCECVSSLAQHLLTAHAGRRTLQLFIQ